MAKFSCSYFLLLVIVFSVCLMVEKSEGMLCEITIDQEQDCEMFFCTQDCARHYNGVGECLDDPTVFGPRNCRCKYNC
ncbi:unnamed protein product [Brassica oleracea]